MNPTGTDGNGDWQQLAFSFKLDAEDDAQAAEANARYAAAAASEYPEDWEEWVPIGEAPDGEDEQP